MKKIMKMEMISMNRKKTNENKFKEEYQKDNKNKAR